MAKFRRKRTLGFILSIVCIILIYNYFNKNTVQSGSDLIEKNVDKNVENMFEMVSDLSNLTEESKIKPLHVRAHLCRPILKETQKAENEWKDYVKEQAFENFNGVELDVFVKSVYLQNGRFTAYRVQRVLQSQGSFQQAKDLKFRQHLIASGVDKEFASMLSHDLPKDFFKNYFSLPDDERSIDKIPFGLSVEQVANEINKKYLTESQLIELFGLLDNINGYINSPANSRPANLIEAIIDSQNMQLFNAFLNGGGVINNPSIGVNMLERWVLTNASNSSVKPNIDMLRALVARGLPLRSKNIDLTVLRLGGYIGDLITVESYQKLVGLLIANEVNLVDAPSNDLLLDEPDVVSILSELNKYKQAFMLKELPEIKKQDIEYCNAVNSEVENSIKVEDFDSLVMQVKEISVNDTEEIAKNLHQISPRAAECFIKPLHNYERTIGGGSNIGIDIYRLMKKQLFAEALKELLKTDPDLNTKASFYWMVIESFSEMLPLINEAGIGPHKNDFYYASRLNVEQFNVMTESGYTFDGYSPSGDSLVKFASSSCNHELLNELSIKGYPYGSNSVGVDAFGVALKSLRRCKTPQEKERLIGNLMQFGFDVENHHLESMAVLKFRDWKLYNSIVKKYPQLDTKDAIQATESNCYVSF